MRAIDSTVVQAQKSSPEQEALGRSMGGFICKIKVMTLKHLWVFSRRKGLKPWFPPAPTPKNEPRTYDKVIYQERHLIECFFGKIKHYRRVFSRFDKKARNFLSFLHFVSVLIWVEYQQSLDSLFA